MKYKNLKTFVCLLVATQLAIPKAGFSGGRHAPDLKDQTPLVDRKSSASSNLTNNNLESDTIVDMEGIEEINPVTSSYQNGNSLTLLNVQSTILPPEQRGEFEERMNHYMAGRGISNQKLVKLSDIPSIAIGTTGTSFLFFLGRELAKDFTGSEVVGDAVGAIAHTPIAFLVTKMVMGKQSHIARSFDPDWKKLRNQTQWKDRLLQMGSTGIGIVMATTGAYYTYFYYEPLIGKASWGMIVPTFVAQTILGSASIEGLGGFLKKTALKYWSCCKTNDQKMRENVDLELGKIIAGLKTLSDEQIEKVIEAIDSGRFLDAMAGVPKVEVSAAEDRLVSASGVAGGVIGLVGMYAMLTVSQKAVSWLLEDMFGIPAEIVQPIATGSGYVSGIAMGAFRGLGCKGTFQNIINYGRSCCGNNRSKMGCKKIVADSVAGVLGAIATASRVEIVRTTDISPVWFKGVVLGCAFLSTGSNDFYGWKSLFDAFADRSNKRVTLIKVLENLKTDLDKLDPSAVQNLYEYLVQAPLNSQLN